MTDNLKLPRLYKFLLYFGIFGFLVFVFYCFPKVGDDWFFGTPTSLQACLESIRSQYIHTNGRVIGNLASTVFADLKIFSVFVKSVVTFGIFFIIRKSAPHKSAAITMLCFALVFAVPQAIFRETYSWSAGFWNYVPPAVSLLAIAAADSKIIIGKGKIKPAAVLLLCILTLCGQLYMEHCTIAAVLFSLGALIIYIIKYKKLSLTLLFQTVFAVTGAVIMFSSPIYGNVADGSDTYRTMEFSLDKLLGTAMINFNVISRYGIKESVAIYIVAAALLTLLILKNKSKHRALNIAVITANAIMPVYFLLSRYISPQFFPVSHFKFAFYFDIFAIAFYAALLSFSVCIYVRDSLIKTQILVLICLALLMCGPLLAVTPIGPRCFYAIYILLAAVVIQLLSYCITVCGLKPQKLTAPAAIVFCAVILFYGYIAADMHKLETQKIDYIESQMMQGASEITLPKFKFGDYLHDPDSGKIKYEYKYSYPGDIEFEYLPYDEWLKIKK